MLAQLFRRSVRERIALCRTYITSTVHPLNSAPPRRIGYHRNARSRGRDASRL